jgi:hypothetical protein
MRCPGAPRGQITPEFPDLCVETAETLVEGLLSGYRGDLIGAPGIDRATHYALPALRREHGCRQCVEHQSVRLHDRGFESPGSAPRGRAASA